MFSFFPPEGLLEVTGQHEPGKVFLSIIIAILASFTALTMNERAKKTSFFHQSVWLVLASLAMGFGIWSMHFMGMSAFSVPFHMEHAHFWTLVSIFPAVGASFLAFYLSNRKRSLITYILAGVTMGAGISAMHYLGMASMQFDGVYTYNPLLFTLSVIVAITVSFVALFIFSNAHRWLELRIVKLLTAVIMGLAIASMHYVGMASLHFYVPSTGAMEMHEHGGFGFLTYMIFIGILLLLGIAMFSSVMDRYIEFRFRHFDGLTHLPNRRQFEDRLTKKDQLGAMAIWHIHDLEFVNQRYGYIFGDMVIKHIASELQKAQLPFTEIYRMDGNRFAVLSTNRNVTLLQAMQDLGESVKRGLLIRDQNISVEMICAYVAGDASVSNHAMFRNAVAVLDYPGLTFDEAVVEYDPVVHRFSYETLLLHSLDDALQDDDLFLVYQPKVSAGSRKLMGFEALLRWNHKTEGFISPGVFIPVFEQHHRIHEVTDWVIDHAARQLEKWNETGFSDQRVAINIPGTYITSSRLDEAVDRAISTYAIFPHQLELEVTETSIVESLDQAVEAIQRFRGIGLSVALDDFGTGVSSLSFLRQIPINTLKIDKSFVDRIPSAGKDAAIMNAIITLGQSLELKIVAEGVEEKDQLEFLFELDPSIIVQGYYFSKPMKVEEVIQWKNRLLLEQGREYVVAEEMSA